MTNSHDQYEVAIAGYALNALDDSERRAFEAHVRTCERCQAELAEFRRVNAGLGMGVEEIAPPAALKAKTIARATAVEQRLPEARVFVPRAASGRRTTDRRRDESPARRSSALVWLAAAASVAAILSAGYAWSLRDQLQSAQSTAADAAQRALMLARELENVRRDSAALVQHVRVLSSPDLVRVDLKGQPTAPNAIGRAFLSASTGLFFNARDLPMLPSDKAYQLWVIAAGKPVSVGMIAADANGALTYTGALTAELNTVSAVAVTAEPKAGSAAPTMPIVLMGPVAH